MIGNVNRGSSMAFVCGGASISEDVIPGDAARSACVVAGICTDTSEGTKVIASEAAMHAPHSQRAGLCRICADRSSARAAEPISELTTTE
jgi:hypothetical protein